jgi:uncharacterized membrane protein YfhO
VWIVYQAEVLQGQDQTLDRISQPDFEPYSQAVLNQPTRSSLPGQQEGVPQASVVELSPTRLAVDVDHGANGLLVFSEIFYPGWQATVDGHATPIHRANAILRAVEVPAGQHRVAMDFNPPSVKLGLATSGATLLLSAAYIMWCLISCVRKPDPK